MDSHSYQPNGSEQCPGLGETLSAHLDSELDAETRRFVDAHLQDCLRCSAEFAEMRQVKQFLSPGSPFTPPIPHSMAQRIRTHTYDALPRNGSISWSEVQLQATTLVVNPEKKGRQWSVVPLFAGALVLLLLVTGVTLLLFNPFAPSPTAQAATASLDDHAKCEQMGQIPQSLAGDATQVRTTLASLIGMSVAAPDNLPSGFQFAGGRSIQVASLRLVNLAWMEKSRMLSFYQAADPGGEPPQGWRSVEMDGRTFWFGTHDGDGGRAVLWRDAGVLYVIVGDLPESDLLHIALSVKETGPLT